MTVSKHNDFRISITKLIKNPGTLQEISVKGSVSEVFVSSAWLEADQDVHLVGTLESVHSGIMFVGSIKTDIKYECRRCLTVGSKALDLEVCELFEKDFQEDRGDTYPIVGDFIDFTDMTRDALVLGLPSAPLCSEHCQGLCQTCGSNLNEVQCNHHDDGIDPRFRILDQLK